MKKIVQAYQRASEKGVSSVLASVVALEGSSYRRPGVRMLILENGNMIGAVSGGCVEKEIARQAASVFKDGKAKMMTYDGRYRLGCEGILYILIEPFKPSKDFLQSFWSTIKTRQQFGIRTYFKAEDSISNAYGSVFEFEGGAIGVRAHLEQIEDTSVFKQQMDPCFRLFIIGAEHDAVQLCSYAALTGWEVTVVVPPSEEKTIDDFPGATEFLAVAAEAFDPQGIDDQTAVILMTHSYVKDLKFLLRLKDVALIYLGLLGPAARREKLLSEFLEHCPEVADTFFDRIHGPAGLAIGSETPQEIAISVLSEIISVVRKQEPMPLKDKKGTIHSR
ncbi:MAG: XdhC family protein [Flavobacteriaceae bacterium]